MAKKIQVIVDVQSESVQISSDRTLTLTQQVRLLRQELQKVPEGTKEWTLLQQKYNETKDSLDRVNVKSKELFGTMSALPGPIGQVSNQLDNTISTLKVFSGFKLSDLKSQLAEAGKDVASIGKRLLEVTGITRVYTVLNTALAKSFTAVGVAEGTAAAGARAFAGALTATGVGAIVVVVGLLVEKVIELGQAFFSTEKEAAALESTMAKFDNAFARSRQTKKELYERETALLKAQGGTEKQLYDKRIEYIDGEVLAYENLKKTFDIQRRAKLELAADDKEKAKVNEEYDKKEVDRLNKISDLRIEKTKTSSDFVIAQNKKAEDAATKAAEKEAQRIERLKQARMQALQELSKADEEAFKATLTEREKEEYEINQKYAAFIATATKYGQDTKVLEAGLQAELKAMREKFNKEDTDNAKKKADDDLKAIEDANKKKFEAEKTAAELKYSQGKQSEEEYQAELYQIKLKYATTDQERQQAEIDFLDFAKGKQKEYEDTVKSANKAITDSYQTMASSIGSSFSEIARLFEQGSDLQKTFAIIGVLINAAAAIGKIRTSTAEAISDFTKTIATGTATVASGVALLSNPITAAIGAAQVAAGKAAIATGTAGIATAKTASTVQQVGVGISAAAQVAAITSAGKSKSTGGAAATSSGGAQPATPAFNGTVTVPAPVVGASQASQSGTLATTIAGAVAEGNSRSRPIQTYVIGDQVSTQQQLDRRISLAAKMGG